MVDPQIQDLRDKIQAHTGCREAIIRLGEIMTKKGGYAARREARNMMEETEGATWTNSRRR